MPGFVDSVIQSLRQSVDLPLLLYFFLIQLIEAVVGGLVLVFFALLGFIALFGSIDFGNLQGLEQMFSNPAALVSVVGWLVLLFAFLFIILTYVSAFFTGMRLNLFNNFLKGGKLDLGKAFEQAKPRAFTYFKIDLLISLVLLLFFGLLFALAFVPILGYFPGSPPPSAIGAFLVTLVLALFLALLAGIALFFLAPVFFLLSPVAFFERLGPIDSIKRSVALAKASYWGNLGFVVMYVIAMMVVGLVVNIFLRILSLPFIFSAAAMSQADASAVVAGMLSSMAFLWVLYAIIIIPYTVWSMAFQTAALRNLYFLDLGLGRPKARKGKKA